MKLRPAARRLCAVLFALAAASLYGQTDALNEDEYYLLEEEGEGITIVASPETTQQKKTITREEIEKIHAADLPALLEQALDIPVTRYGPRGSAAEINIRGFDTERIAVLVNGIPVNSPLSGDFDFAGIDLDSVERIEVIYGGSDSKYNVSGALGGVINIVTVKKQEKGLKFSGSVSNTSALPGRYNKQYGGVGGARWEDLADAQNLHLSAAYGAGDWSLALNAFGSRAGNHFLYKDYYGFARRKEGNELADGGFSGIWLRELSDGYSKLIAGADIYSGVKQVPSSGDTREGALEKDFVTRENIMLDMPALGEKIGMEASLSHSWYRMDYDTLGEDSLHRMHNFDLINRWSLFPLEKLTLRSGFDYRFSYLDSTNTGTLFGNRGGLYFNAEYAPLEALLIVPSVKVVLQDRDAKIQAAPIPKLGLSLQAAENITIKNNYFRSFKYPDFEDLYWIQEGFYGNRDLKNEDGWGTDLGVEITFGKPNTKTPNYRLEGGGFAQWTVNSIHWSYQ
ncbi:MAG: TonB-dependent receptor plug domain-containing protein, partial [Treponema sp.]|nr:TonB-dependent receptor plug domain-containing protein [Treponema sp.]